MERVFFKPTRSDVIIFHTFSLPWMSAVELSSSGASQAVGGGSASSGTLLLSPPVQLTFGGSSSGVTHGLADFVAQEEMDRYRGFWWSLDSSSIAFTEV